MTEGTAMAPWNGPNKLYFVRTPASLAVIDGFVAVAIEALLAVVAVASVGVVSTLDTDAAADVTRQLVELHVEATLTCVPVTLARYTHTHTHTQTTMQHTRP